MANEITVLGIDLGKNWYHVVGIDQRGQPILRKKLNRTQLGALAASNSRCVVAMESCPGSQYWGRRFAAHGHDLKIMPAQFVKPYLKSNKNDFNDAEAIAEAASRATMRCVPLKNTSSWSCRRLIAFGSALSSSEPLSSIRCALCCLSTVS
jgi:transposase